MIHAAGFAMTGNAGTSDSRPVARRQRLEARISVEQKDLLLRAAELQGRSLSDFVVSSAHEAAVRTIEATQAIRLDAEESLAFAGTLLDPPEPSPRLMAASRRYSDRRAD
ncbi:MAG: DUF1778 domain-containing protein [Geminicoccaceae bacterium]